MLNMQEKKMNLVVQHLNIRLVNQYDIQIITQTIEDVINISPFSANQLKTYLQNQIISSNVFEGLRTFLGLLEDVRYYTYQDPKGYMTLGIGLNLDNPDSEALIISVNEKFHLNLVYKDLRDTPGLPSKGLTDEQVNYLFWLSLVGAEHETDHGKIKFVGLVDQLIHQLDHHVPGLADVPFQPYQLIALQSLAFNSPGLIGTGLCTALKEYATTGNFLDALIEIVEESNRENSIGLSNRRLKDAGLFLGNPEAIRLPYRQVMKIMGIHNHPDLIGGPAIYPLPVGNEENIYSGGENIITVPGRDPEHLNSITYGSLHKDAISIQDGSKVVFGGDDNDAIHVTASSPQTSYHYLAGNNGLDSYELPAMGTGKLIVYDTDHLGKIIQAEDVIEGIVINSLLRIKNRKYKVSRFQNPDGTNEIRLTEDFSPDEHIALQDFKGGQFNIVLLGKSNHIEISKDMKRVTAAVLPSGNTVLLISKGRIPRSSASKNQIN